MVIVRRIADGLTKNPIANRIPPTNSEKDAMNPKKVWKDSTPTLFSPREPITNHFSEPPEIFSNP
jgi:hypothetical protein